MRALLAALLLAAGCGGKPQAGGPVVLRYLAAPDAAGVGKEVARRFEAENPGIKVEIVEGPAATNTREDLYASSLMAHEDTYDVVFMDVVWMPKFAAQGWLLPLDREGWLDERLQGELLAPDLAASRFGGRVYRLPTLTDAGLLYYRKDLLDAAGLAPPRTWDELVQDARRLRARGRAGLVFEGRQYEGLVCCFLELLWGFGGALQDEKGRVALADPPGAAALSALVAGLREGVIPAATLNYQEEEARRAFQSGGAVFMRNWPYAWAMLQARDSPVRGKVGVAPMVHGPGGKSAAALGGWGFGISAYSRHPREAWRFLAFNARKDVQRLAWRRGGGLPTRRELYGEDPALARFRPALEAARARPVVPNYARISDAVQLHVSAALTGQEEPEAALEAASAEIRVAVSP